MPPGPADPMGSNQQIAQTEGGELVDRRGQQLSQRAAGTDPGLTLRSGGGIDQNQLVTQLRKARDQSQRQTTTK